MTSPSGLSSLALPSLLFVDSETIVSQETLRVDDLLAEFGGRISGKDTESGRRVSGKAAEFGGRTA